MFIFVQKGVSSLLALVSHVTSTLLLFLFQDPLVFKYVGFGGIQVQQWKVKQQSNLKVLVLLLKKKYNQVLYTCVSGRKVSLKILSFHHHPYYYINNINYILNIETGLLFWVLLYEM